MSRSSTFFWLYFIFSVLLTGAILFHLFERPIGCDQSAPIIRGRAAVLLHDLITNLGQEDADIELAVRRSGCVITKEEKDTYFIARDIVRWKDLKFKNSATTLPMVVYEVASGKYECIDSLGDVRECQRPSYSGYMSVTIRK